MRDATTGPELRTLWEKNYSVYGRRKLWKAANVGTSTSGGTRSPGSCDDQGICGATRAKKRFTTKSDRPPSGPRTVNRDFTAPRSDALWVADLTYARPGRVSSMSPSSSTSSPAGWWLEGGPLHDHRPRPRRPQHGRLDQAPHQLGRAHLSYGCGSEYTSVLYTDRIDEVTDSAMALSNESPTVPMKERLHLRPFPEQDRTNVGRVPREPRPGERYPGEEVAGQHRC